MSLVPKQFGREKVNQALALACFLHDQQPRAIAHEAPDGFPLSITKFRFGVVQGCTEKSKAGSVKRIWRLSHMQVVLYSRNVELPVNSLLHPPQFWCSLRKANRVPGRIHPAARPSASGGIIHRDNLDLLGVRK